jgi:hypothetical protein
VDLVNSIVPNAEKFLSLLITELTNADPIFRTDIAYCQELFVQKSLHVHSVFTLLNLLVMRSNFRAAFHHIQSLLNIENPASLAASVSLALACSEEDDDEAQAQAFDALGNIFSVCTTEMAEITGSLLPPLISTCAAPQRPLLYNCIQFVDYTGFGQIILSLQTFIASRLQFIGVLMGLYPKQFQNVDNELFRAIQEGFALARILPFSNGCVIEASNLLSVFARFYRQSWGTQCELLLVKLIECLSDCV